MGATKRNNCGQRPTAYTVHANYVYFDVISVFSRVVLWANN
jgi:hypothetical protein